jgi:hypothetical protein
LDVIRHGGMTRLFGGVCAPSTLSSFLRAFTHGHTRQVAGVARRFLVDLAARTPVLAGATETTYVDIDSLLRRVYGKRKQDASFGHAKIGGYSVRLRGLAVGGHDLRADRGAGGRGDAAAQGIGGLEPGAQQPADRSVGDRSRRGIRRPRPGAGGLGLLRGRGDQRDTPRRGCGSR